MSSKLMSLELRNFKSYRYLLIDDFEKFSLIAIIGDNGQGKSNIIDAILYALGINNCRTLRIKKFSDLVHCSETQDDIANICTVKLKIQTNEDVQVFERTSSMSGQNQYLFNGMTISEAQYLENLNIINTNLALRNFFILQGNIQQVANLSEKTMTAFVERACGSDKFITDHERFAKNYDRAQQALVMVRKEMKRLKKLKKNVQKQGDNDRQRDFLDQELNKQRVLCALFIAKHLSQEIQSGQQDFEKQTNKLEQFDVEISKIEDELQRVLAQKENTMLILRDAEVKLAKCDAEYTKFDCKKTSLMEEFVSFVKWEDSTMKDIENLRQEEKKYNASLQNLSYTLEAKINEGNEAKELLEKRIDPTEADKIDYYKIKTRIEQRILDNDEDLQQGIDTSFKLNMCNIQFNAKESVTNMNRELCGGWKSEVEKLEEEVRSKFANLQSLEENADRTITKLKEKIEINHKKLDQLCDVIELDCSLKEIEKKQEEEQMEQLINHYAVSGKLFDLVDTVEPISWTESHNLESMVVDSFETALKCGRYLNIISEGIGHQFLPLDTLVYEEPSTALANIPNIVPVRSLLSYDNTVRAAVLHGCENAVLAEDMEIAQAFSENKNVKVFTRNGTCLHPSGLITTNIVKGRRRNESENVKGLNDNFIKNVQEIRNNINDLEFDINRQSQILEAREGLTAEQQRLEQTKRVCDFFSNEVQTNEDALQTLRNEIDELNTVVLDTNAVHKAIEDEEFALFCEKLEVRDIQEYRERTEFANNLDLITEKTDDIKKSIISSENNLSRVKEGIARRLEQLQTIHTTKMSKNEQLKEVDMEMANTNKVKLMKFFTSQAEKLDAVRKNEQRLRDNIASLERKKFTGNQLCNELRNKEKVAQDRFKIHLQQCAEKLIILPVQENDEDVLDYHELPTADLRIRNPKSYASRLETYQSKINEIEAQIEKLGHFENRLYENIADINSDIGLTVVKNRDALQLLRDAQEKLQEVASQRKECICNFLHDIKAPLDTIYKKLAGPNSCAEILPLNPDVPYCGGISYMVTIKNKGFMRIIDLSSGEKTLAALALYYALAEYKPTSILLLDEVDAFLDPLNLDRMAEFLGEKKADEQQGIIITHKPETASRADALMGVVSLDTGDTGVVKYKH